jgi:hypothetical protein
VDLFIGIAHLLVFHNFLLGLVDLEIDRSVMNVNFSGFCVFFAMGIAMCGFDGLALKQA